ADPCPVDDYPSPGETDLSATAPPPRPRPAVPPALHGGLSSHAVPLLHPPTPAAPGPPRLPPRLAAPDAQPGTTTGQRRRRPQGPYRGRLRRRLHARRQGGRHRQL